MIAGRVVAALSATQMILWGVTFYAVGVFSGRIVADTGLSLTTVHGGFSLALVIMGLVSPAVGRAIDRAGGRRIMAAGSALSALGLVVLAATDGPLVWFAGWVILGVAMRLSLYDAAFAALVRIDPADARRALSTVALSGGLASTVFWIVGEFLAARFGWRPAVFAFAGFALATLPLHLMLPRARANDHVATGAGSRKPTPPLARTPAEERLAARLFGVLIVAVSVLASALAAQIIPLMAAVGLAGSAAVWVATTRGIGQSVARFVELASGSRLHPLDLTVLACALLPLTLAFAPFAGASIAAALVFAVGGGMGNGLVTVARGAVPLVLFDPRAYGTITGRLGAPAFWASALAPVGIAFVLDRFGTTAAFAVLAVPALAAAGAALALRLRFAPKHPLPPPPAAEL